MAAVYLISTPSRITHSFGSSALSIFPFASNAGDQAHFSHRGPFERHSYGLRMGTLPTGRPEVRSFALDIDQIVGMLSLWYGKQVTSHGTVLLEDIWTLPNTLSITPNPYYELPLFGGQHTKPPVISCDWRGLEAIGHLFARLADAPSEEMPITTAARCYGEALRLLPNDREVSYIRLVQALECMSASAKYTDEQRFSHDRQLWDVLQWLGQCDSRQARSALSLLRSRLYQVSRGVTLWLEATVDDGFFSSGTSCLEAERMAAAVSGAYALRSLYVHQGARLGDYVDPVDHRCGELETVPDYLLSVCRDGGVREALRRAPAFLGLERLVRHSLISQIRSEAA